MKNASLALSKIKQFEEFDRLYSSMSPEKILEVQKKLEAADNKKSQSIARKAVVDTKLPSEKSGIANIPPQRPSMQLSFLAEMQAAGSKNTKAQVQKVESAVDEKLTRGEHKISSQLSFLAEVQAAGNVAKKQGMEISDSAKTIVPIVADKSVSKTGKLKR